MATSKNTITQVRDILRKLDRSIDEARERRLGQDEEPAPARREPEPSPELAPKPEAVQRPVPGQATPQRARPMRRPETNGFHP